MKTTKKFVTKLQKNEPNKHSVFNRPDKVNKSRWEIFIHPLNVISYVHSLMSCNTKSPYKQAYYLSK